jgi:hypothetical protein
MASIPVEGSAGRSLVQGSLSDPARAIGGPLFDAIFFWGAPLLASCLVWAWVLIAMILPRALGQPAVSFLLYAVLVLTFAHLIAVVPRAYLNRQVFADNRLRLVAVPILLVAGLLLSPVLLVCAAVLTVFWDVHHSAMQTFGIGRIYDMKSGNGAHVLRNTDLRLNWALYVGPIAAGASLLVHFRSFADFGRLDWALLAAMPGVVAGHAGPIHYAAIAAWAAILLWSIHDYRAAAARGYRMPAHKAALIGATGTVSVCAWGLAPPFVAFTIINLFHAVQYFALVWLKEGERIGQALEGFPKKWMPVFRSGSVPDIESRAFPIRRGDSASPDKARGGAGTSRRFALPVFLILCAGFGIAYAGTAKTSWLIAPFVACSLLHFWFDSFVWSVRKKQV